jgi:hypothetical protein
MKVNEIGKVRTTSLISTPEHLFTSSSAQRLISLREVLLMEKPLLEQGRSIAVIAPHVMNNDRPVYITQLDYSTHCCQEGQFLVHFCSMSELRAIVDQLIENQDCLIFRAAFDVTEGVAEPLLNTVVVNSPTIEELPFGTNWFLEQAKGILEKIAPETPFYPPATEVEVLIADDIGVDSLEQRVGGGDVVQEKSGAGKGNEEKDGE